MTQPIHTSGPLHIKSGNAEPYIKAKDGLSVAMLPFSRSSEVREANSRLLTASYNAFDSAAQELGLNAVEFAERMQDGGIAELFDLLYQAIEEDNIRVAGENLSHFDRGFRARARDILAKVKEQAA